MKPANIKPANIEGFPVQPMACVTYNETSRRDPITNRWRRGPILKTVTVYVVVDGQPITLATIEKDVT